jgi:diguanylate cyclase (GGDEF)-like protein/PAS domain S-box-containing protein
MKLSRKILFFIITPAILPIIIILFFYFNLFEPSVISTIEEGIRNTSASLGDEINQLITESVLNTNLLAQNNDLQEVDFRRTRDFHNIFKDISYVDSNGQIMSSVDYSFRGEIKETKWFTEALNGKIIISDIHALLNPFAIVMTVICPVRNIDTSIDSLIVAELNLEKLWQIVERTALRSDAEIVLIDEKGIIVYARDHDRILKKYPVPVIYEESKKMNRLSFKMTEKKKEMSYFLNPMRNNLSEFYLNWNILYIRESKDVYSSLIYFRRTLFIIGTLSIILISSLTFFISSNVRKRLFSLLRATKQLSKGNYSVKISDTGNDEISDLINTFSYAQNQLNISENIIRTANERFKLAVEGANDAIWDWDLKSDIIYFAPKWFDFIGIESDESFSAEDWFNIIHPSDQEYFKRKLYDLFHNNETYFEQEYRIIVNDKSVKWIMTRGIVLYDENGMKSRMAGSHSDITERKNMQQRVSFFAYYDSLTELPNRTKLLDNLNQALNRAFRKEDYSFSLLYLDFDGFKHVNDTYGHSVGDLLLINIAHRLKDCVRPLDLVSRVGGDEFIILLDGIENNTTIESILKRILETSRKEFLLNDHSIYISVSIGIVTESSGSSKPDDLIRKADIAMYYSKINGKDKYTFFKEDLQKKEVKRWSLEHELHNALGTSALMVYYQPIIETQTKEIFSFEALLRWNHPVKGMIPPDEFIPSAEETGFISQITKWLLEEICRQAVIWNSDRIENYIKISFNVTAKDFFIPGGLDQLIESTLNDTACLPGWIALEVTEGTMIKDFGSVMKQIRKIRKTGISIELDDFGTGYSSLSYLNKFEIDYLKIDQSFIRSMLKDSMSYNIVKTIINLAHDLDLNIIAEGVETADEVTQLLNLGCEYIQGYYYARPLSVTDASRFLDQNSPVDITVAPIDQ